MARRLGGVFVSLLVLSVVVYMMRWNNKLTFDMYVAKLHKIVDVLPNTSSREMLGLEEKEDEPVRKPITSHVLDETGRKANLLKFLSSKFNLKADSDVIRPDCNAPFLVFYCGSHLCGGIGDRMKGIISTFILALITNRNFAIIHTKPCSLQGVIEPNVYDWSYCEKQLNHTISVGDVQTINYVTGGRAGLRTAEDLSTLFTRRVVLVRSNVIVALNWFKENALAVKAVPFLRDLNLETICSEVLHVLFNSAPALTDAIASIVKPVRKANKELVCGHVRMAQNPSIPKDNPRLKFKPNVTEVFRFFDQFTSMSQTTIFVATDADEVRQNVTKRYSNSVSTNRKIVHVDRFERDGTECDGMFTGFLDYYILTFCDRLLLTRSNYGTMAAYIRASSKELYCYLPANQTIVPCKYNELNSIYKYI